MSTSTASSPFKMIRNDDAGKDKFNERMYVRKLLKLLPPLRTHGDKWYAYDGRAWRVTEKEFFRGQALEILPERHQVARHAKAVMDHVEIKSQIGVDDKLAGAVKFDDKRRVLLNVANGVLQVSATEVVLLPHKEEYLFTGALEAAWEEGAKCPLFERVTLESLPAVEDRALLHWCSGYTLFPDSKQHEIFLICFGEAGTGKSTVMGAIMGVMGSDPLVTSLSMAQLCSQGQGAYSLPGLQYALVNLGTELDTVELDDSSAFKRLVSGETIEARTIYGRPFPMTPTVKLIFLSNSLPRFKHGTDAELRRSRFLCFDRKRTDADKDTTLKDKLPLERSGILRWMVEGLQAVLGGEPAPAGGVQSRAVKEKFAINNDAVTAFVKAHCVLGVDRVVHKNDLYAAFTSYLEGYGFSQKSKEHLFKQIYERYPGLSVTQVRTKQATNERPSGHYVRGIELREAWEE